MSLSQADLLMRIATLEDKVTALEARPKVGGGRRSRKARSSRKGRSSRSASRKGRSASRK